MGSGSIWEAASTSSGIIQQMVSLATSIVNRAFRTNEGSIAFLRQLIIVFVIAGIIIGVLGCYWTKFVWLVEVFIVPVLIRSINSYRSINQNNINLLKGANETLRGAREQKEIEDRIKREKANE